MSLSNNGNGVFTAAQTAEVFKNIKDYEDTILIKPSELTINGQVLSSAGVELSASDIINDSDESLQNLIDSFQSGNSPYLPTAGGTMTGELMMDSEAAAQSLINIQNGKILFGDSTDSGYTENASIEYNDSFQFKIGGTSYLTFDTTNKAVEVNGYLSSPTIQLNSAQQAVLSLGGSLPSEQLDVSTINLHKTKTTGQEKIITRVNTDGSIETIFSDTENGTGWTNLHLKKPLSETQSYTIDVPLHENTDTGIFALDTPVSTTENGLMLAADKVILDSIAAHKISYKSGSSLGVSLTSGTKTDILTMSLSAGTYIIVGAARLLCSEISTSSKIGFFNLVISFASSASGAGYHASATQSGCFMTNTTDLTLNVQNIVEVSSTTTVRLVGMQNSGYAATVNSASLYAYPVVQL